jgi:internalin A
MMKILSILAFLIVNTSFAQVKPDPYNCSPETIIELQGELESRFQWQFYQEFQGVITCGDLQSLRQWSAQVGVLDDLSGLEYAINLESLSLQTVPLTKGLEPLRNLNKLQRLDISCVTSTQWPAWCGNVSDVSPLANLTNLETLILEGQEIRDISALAALTQLPRLSLSTNYINDITALVSLTNLHYLNLSHNEITDISALAYLTNLEVLYLEGNCLQSLEPLIALKKLRILSIGGDPHDLKACVFEDFSPLAKLTQLELLTITDSNFQDLSLLSKLSNLDLSQGLGFPRNNITDLRPLFELEDLTTLKDIVLTGNNLSTLYPLLNHLDGFDSDLAISLEENCLDPKEVSQVFLQLPSNDYTYQYFQKASCFTRIPAPWGP